MKYVVLPTLLILTFSILYYYIFPRSVQELCDLDTCPVCFGTNLCKEIKENKITLHYNSIEDFIFNILSVKNVYFADFDKRKVVLKKLTYNSELRKLDSLTMNGNYSEIADFLVNGSDAGHFKVCDSDSARLFLQKLSRKDVRNVEAIVRANIEPILLEMFNSDSGWPVPKLYGSCGRLVVVENTGHPLYYTRTFNWFEKAYLAFQILRAARNFTENHEDFRLYLTDISPDNIAVADSLKITFIDLESAILKRKTSNGTVHYTEHFNEELYIYSEKEICDGSISDHNIYAVCRLLLSKQAPWPMMENGLLHTPPETILESYSELFDNIELCVFSKDKTSRFTLSDKILNKLETILKVYTNYTI